MNVLHRGEGLSVVGGGRRGGRDSVIRAVEQLASLVDFPKFIVGSAQTGKRSLGLVP